MMKSKVASFSGKDGFNVFLITHVWRRTERHETTKKLDCIIRRCQGQARLKTYGSLRPFVSFDRRLLAPMICTRRVTRGSSPGLGVKALDCLKEGEETLRGNFVLRTFNALVGAGTMVVVLLDQG